MILRFNCIGDGISLSLPSTGWLNNESGRNVSVKTIQSNDCWSLTKMSTLFGFSNNHKQDGLVSTYKFVFKVYRKFLTTCIDIKGSSEVLLLHVPQESPMFWSFSSELTLQY